MGSLKSQFAISLTAWAKYYHPYACFSGYIYRHLNEEYDKARNFSR
jgi:hypothetical protein